MQKLSEQPKRRKSIPVGVKLEVALRTLGYRESEINWDHNPPLALRAWDPITNDTVPPANDPEFIQILSVEQHKQKTTGRRGESRLSARDGDVAAIAKMKRLTKKQEAYRQRLLVKEDPDAEEPETKAKPKYRWPKRKFDNRKKAEARPEEG